MAPKTRSTPSLPARIQLWVRRGALRRFDRLKRDTAHLPVTVDWDRRDPASGGPQGQERRAAPPFTWEAADFVVSEAPDDDRE
ncbi:MAG TPA: hypothetical protein VIX63_15770 [Vicinamibacterales bacterium]